MYLDPEKTLQPWQPTRFKIGNLLEAMAAVLHLDETTDQPSWIGEAGHPVVAVANGLLRLDGRELLPHTGLLQPDGRPVRLRSESAGTGRVAALPHRALAG